MPEKLVSAIYEAGLQGEVWQYALEQISDAFGGTPMFLGHGEIRNFRDAETWTVNYDDMVLGKFEGEQADFDRNPGFDLIARCPVATVIDRDTLYSAGVPQWDLAARHFIDSQGMFHFLLSAVQRDEHVFSPLFLTRPSHAPFDHQDRHMLDEISEHIGRSMRLRRALDLMNARGMGYVQTLDRLSQGIFLTDGTLRIRHMNLAAEEISERGDGLYRKHGCLRVGKRAAQLRLEDLARRLSGRHPDFCDERVVVRRPSHALPYMLTILPLVGDASCAFSGAPQVMILVNDPERHVAAVSARCIALDYGLTGAESRIAELAARALPVPEIARLAGVSANTVKTHLKAVYSKLGVRGQAELVRLLLAQAQSVHDPRVYGEG